MRLFGPGRLHYRRRAAAAALVVALPTFQSVRFAPLNGEYANSTDSGIIQIPKANIVTSGNRWFADGHSVIWVGELPIDQMNALNRVPVLFGNGSTVPTNTFICWFEGRANSGTPAPRLRFTHNVAGTGGAGGSAYINLPTNFSGKTLLSVYRSGLDILYKLVDLETLTETSGTLYTMTAANTGYSTLQFDIALGGRRPDLFPDFYFSAGIQNNTGFRGWVGAFALLDSTLTSAELQAIATGASIQATATTAKCRYLLEPGGGGSTPNLVPVANIAASNAIVLGTVYAGPNLRPQSTASYITIDGLKEPTMCAVLPGSTTTRLPVSGRLSSDMYGLSIEYRLLTEDGYLKQDWAALVTAPASGTTWSGAVSLPLNAKALHIELRCNGVVWRENRRILVGWALSLVGQSEMEFVVINSYRLAGKVLDAGLKERVYQYEWDRTNLTPLIRSGYGYTSTLSDGSITIANYIGALTPYPIFIGMQAIAGTGQRDLMMDSATYDGVPPRKWSDFLSTAQIIKSRDTSNRIILSARYQNWATNERTYGANFGTQILDPMYKGVAAASIGGGVPDHYLNDGYAAPGAVDVLGPYTKDGGSSGTLVSADANTAQGLARKTIRDWALANPSLVKVGPEAHNYRLDPGTNLGPHPYPEAAGLGLALLARWVAQGFAVGLGLVTYSGPSMVASAAFTDGTRTAIDVTFTAPHAGVLTNLEGSTTIQGFEVSADSGATRSKATFTAAITGADTVRLTKTSGSWSAGTTQVFHLYGGPGGYGSVANGFNDTSFVNQVLMRGQFLAGGDNTAYAVSG